MKAFISYSLNDSEQYILTILSRRLKEYGFSIWSTYDDSISSFDFKTFSQLNKSNLFIGIVTKSGNSNNRVLKEYFQAIDLNIPSLILAEDKVANSPNFQNRENILIFNRENPEKAISFVKEKIEEAKNKQMLLPRKKDNSIAWLLGGIAALIILALLSDD